MIAEHWIALVFSLISAGTLSYCKFLSSKIKEYRRMIEERENNEIEELIDQKINDKIAELQKQLNEEETKFEFLKDKYRHQLIRICTEYLEKGFLTPDEYAELSDLWKTYHGLGGNSQAEEYYRKVEKLPVHE